MITFTPAQQEILNRAEKFTDTETGIAFLVDTVEARPNGFKENRYLIQIPEDRIAEVARFSERAIPENGVLCLGTEVADCMGENLKVALHNAGDFKTAKSFPRFPESQIKQYARAALRSG